MTVIVQWFTIMSKLSACGNPLQRVTGTVNIQLFKGKASISSRSSPYSLYSKVCVLVMLHTFLPSGPAVLTPRVLTCSPSRAWMPTVTGIHRTQRASFASMPCASRRTTAVSN